MSLYEIKIEMSVCCVAMKKANNANDSIVCGRVMELPGGRYHKRKEYFIVARSKGAPFHHLNTGPRLMSDAGGFSYEMRRDFTHRTTIHLYSIMRESGFLPHFASLSIPSKCTCNHAEMHFVPVAVNIFTISNQVDKVLNTFNVHAVVLLPNALS